MAASGVASVRIGLGVGSVRFSSLWILWAQRNDLYLGTRNIAGRLKFSVHGSGVCQVALTDQYWSEVTSVVGLPDRSFNRWRRTPPTEGPIEVASIFFPRDFQRPTPNGFPSKPVEKLPPASPGRTIRLRIFETDLDPEPKLMDALKHFGRPIGHFEMDDGRHFLLAAGEEDFDQSSVAHISKGTGKLKLFNPSMPAVGETIRDLSSLAWSKPSDGEPIQIVELHGIAVRRDS